MATLTEIKNQFAQNSLSNPTNKASSGLLTDNQRQAAFVRYQKEQEEKEKNQGGFFGGIGYAFEKLGLGFLQSIEGIWDFTAGGLADLFGAHDWAEQQIANDWVNYGHADEWFNPSDGWKVAGDMAGGIGTSIPALSAIAVGAAITYFSGGTASPIAVQLITGVTAGLSAGLGAAGTATKEAYNETGQLTGKEWGYGALSGFTEGAMEGVTDAIGFGAGTIVKSFTASAAKEGAKQVGKQVAKSVARQTLGKTMIKGFIGEAFEEGVQELIDPVWKRLTYDPNAENATFQQVAYAALVGGLSGAIMSGADVSIRNSINYFSGSKTTANGGAKGVIDLATTIAETEGVNQSGNAQVDFVVNTLSELQESLQKTNGEVKTAKQKMLVGILSKANTAAPLSIVVSQNADAIVHDAETTVKRLNDIGYKTSDGAEVTVEMLTKGVTGERGTREYRRSLSDAMRTNEALRSVAVMSAAGQLNMDAARFQEATLRGEQLATQADLNHFIETATEAQKRDVGERLGITDWATVTADELKSRVREFSENGGVDQYINERNEIKKLNELEISKKGLPKYVGSITQDGAVRYKFGDASVAIVKNGDTYQVYDYARDVISKPLSKKEANRVIKEIYAASTVSETNTDTQNTTENTSDSQKQTQEIDTFAREHVPDYKKITGAQQQAVRQTLRQARAANVSETDQILYASVAARSGANIEFVSAETLGANADAGYSMKDGKILVNREMANSPKARTAAKILLHEFTHAMIHRGYSVKGKKGKRHIENKVLNDFFTTAIRGLSAEQQLQILTPYIERHGVSVQDFIDGKVDVSIDTYIELREELAAHFVERELGNSAALKRIISDKPSFKDKLLSFLKRSKSDYSSNEKLSRASNALLKKYQNFFNKYATQNRFSPTITGDLSTYQSTEAADTDTGTRLAMSETFNRLGRYTDSEIASIEATKIYQVAKTYNDIQEFIDSALNGRQEQRLFLGKVTAATAAKIYKATGLDVKGKSIALSSSDIRHIFNGHSNVNAEALSGQIAITKSNFENIIETVIEPDEVGRSDANGVVGIVFKKEIDGKITAVTILSEKKKTLTLKSAWITKEKQATSLTLDVQAPSLTSKTGQRIKPVTDSISKKTKNVNPNGKKRYALSETDSETRTLTDEQRRFFQNSKITDNKGRLLVLYHQTDAEFTVFDTSRDGAGMRDNETPHGIFMKPTAENIGLKGNKQMPLYANITNPLRFVDRAQAQKYWRANIEGYASIIDEITANDTKYNAEFEEAFNLERVARRKNLDWKKLNESQQDSLFWESERESERILKEWETANIALDKQAKKLIDAYLKTSGYDGVLVEHDAGSMGRSVKTIIALEPNQVKSINNYTPTKSSDIRFALTSDTQTFDRFANVKEARKYYDNAIAEAYKRYRKVDPLRMRTTTDEKAAFDRYLSEMAALESEKASVVKAVKKRISSTDSAGRSLTPKQIKWASGTKVVDANGHIKAVYHGTGAQFNEFSYDYLGKNGTSYGKGFYFSDSAEYSSGYVSGDGRLMEVYLSIKKPLNATKLTMSRAQVRSFLSALAKYKTVDGISPLSDYADIDSYGINSAINAALDLEMDSNNNDVDIVHSIYNSIAGIELQDYYKILKDTLGFDGIIEHRDSENFYIIFSSNQAKNVTNTAPTESADIRYALPETDSTDINPTESDNSGAIGGLSRGQRAKFVANNTKFKVYSKLDATSVIDSIVAERLTLRDGQFEGVLSGKSRAEVIEKLFTKLNSTPEGYRIGVALNIADYIIDNAVLTDMYDTFNDDSYAMGVLSVMRRYMHRMNLSGIQGEIQHRFDRKNSINLVWGAKQDGVSPNVVAQELQSYGIQIDAIRAKEADQFFEMLELYEGAKEQVNKRTEKVMLTAIGSEAEIEKLRQQIARDVLLAYDEKGTPSKYAKLVEKYTKRIADLKKDLSTAYKRNTLTNRIIDGAAYLRDVATKRNYVGAEIFSAPELTQWLKQLSKIKYRSDLRKTGVRKILLDYGLFYNTNNALLYDENPDLSYIDNNVIDALNFIRQNALSTKPLSMEELQAAEIIIASAKHLFNNYDQIIFEGKKAKISELATEGNEIIKKSKNRTNKTFFNKIYGEFNKIIEPRVVIKSLENFNPNGILTRAYAEITRGETEAGLLYIKLTNDIDTYIKKHKRFKNRLTSEYITVAGAELTVGQAISLYELSKRTQAQEGLYESGFSYIDKKGSKQTAHITEADITAMYDAFTDTDKGFIELVETFFNVLSKQVKTDADMEILGYTNASEDFYFPIKRDSSTIAKNITDARSIMADWANVYNFSFNKDVKTGAKNKLFVTDVYSIVTRHAKQLSIYAKMTVPLKNFSQIYSKNIGDKTNVISIRNTINEQVWGGAEGYLSKLFADIQGMVTSSSFIEKMRGAYAKYQLGANLKVIVSQITSYPTAGIMLDSGVMAKGFVMRTNWAAMDKYCPYARVRNYERGIVRAEGVVDKVGKVGDVLTKPIQWTDRFTIGRLWNACQLQIQKDTGLKYGSVENMQKAGALLEDVIRLTQPNYTNTERSELMRSDSDIVRSFTMFTSVPLKQLSRLVESFGEYNALRSLIKSGDSDPTLSKRYKLAKKKIRRTLAAVTIANLMYVLVGQFFKFLYNDMAEDEKEGKVTAQSFFLDMLNDFGSTTVGMLPVVRDIYGYFANGYEINSFTGDMLNGILSTTKQLFELATKAASGEDIKTQDYMGVFRNSLYGIGQITGIPVRNINNTITGLVRRFSPSAAYSYTSLFYNPKYSKDINAALKKGDYELAETIMGMMLNDDRTGSLNGKATRKLIELYDAGYTVLPKSIGDTLTYKGEEIRLTSAQQSTFKAIYGKANAEIEKTVNSAEFASLPAEKQARAIKLLYDAYYSKAQASVLKLASDNKIIMLSSAIPPSALAPHLSAISAIDSDTDKKGNVISGSKKAKVIKYVLAQKLSTPQKLLQILSLGYTIKDGDIKGVSAAKAKSVVARYISNLSLSRAEKTALAEKCGLKVRNGRIYAA